MILFFDTETTGFVNFNARPDDPCQPHVVQFAAILTDDDGKEISQFSSLVRPPVDFEIPAESTAVHGITTQAANDGGISWINALNLLDDLAIRTKLLVAHNIEFDAAVISCMYARDGRVVSMFDRTGIGSPHFCTMKSSTDICKLPGKYGFKWPKLIEVYRHFFNEDFEGAHDALADVRACMKVYFAIKNLSQPQPEGASL